MEENRKLQNNLNELLGVVIHFSFDFLYYERKFTLLSRLLLFFKEQNRLNVIT